MAISQDDADAAVLTAAGEYLSAFGSDRRPTATRSLLTAALALINQYRPREQQGKITLSPDVSEYPAPIGVLDVAGTGYGQNQLRGCESWMYETLRNLPSLTLKYRAGRALVVLNPAPCADLLALCGRTLNYTYTTPWTLSNLPETATHLIEQAVMVEVAGRRIFSDMHRAMGQGHQNRTQEDGKTAREVLKREFIDSIRAAKWL